MLHTVSFSIFKHGRPTKQIGISNKTNKNVSLQNENNIESRFVLCLVGKLRMTLHATLQAAKVKRMLCLNERVKTAHNANNISHGKREKLHNIISTTFVNRNGANDWA